MSKLKKKLRFIAAGIFRSLKLISGYEMVEKKKALKNKVPIYISPLLPSDNRYFYQLSFFSEFYQYFGGKSMFVPGSNKSLLMIWNLDFGYIPIKYSYDDYFKDVIKSPERALARKAIKNGYTCNEINYDEMLEEIHEINISKDSRQGKAMISDYKDKLKPRQNIVGKIGQEIHTYGCFNNDGKIVAYYMFEHFGNNIFHTVKGIGHADHLKYGVMNFLFAYSISCLYNLYPDGNQILLYGKIDKGPGLARFKRNVGCKFGCPVIKANASFFNDLKEFNKRYKIHDDTGLNFVLEYLS